MKKYNGSDGPVGCPAAAHRLYNYVDVDNRENNTPWQERALLDALELQWAIYEVAYSHTEYAKAPWRAHR